MTLIPCSLSCKWIFAANTGISVVTVVLVMAVLKNKSDAHIPVFCGCSIPRIAVILEKKEAERDDHSSKEAACVSDERLLHPA